jgi:hypothetical protein
LLKVKAAQWAAFLCSKADVRRNNPGRTKMSAPEKVLMVLLSQGHIFSCSEPEQP